MISDYRSKWKSPTFTRRVHNGSTIPHPKARLNKSSKAVRICTPSQGSAIGLSPHREKVGRGSSEIWGIGVRPDYENLLIG